MDYIYLPYNPNRYATNLMRNQNKLQWDSSVGQEVLIVQTPFGKKATDYIEDVCKLLSNGEKLLVPEGYTELLSGVYIKFMTAAQKAQNGGCVLNGEASTYTVFSCYRDSEKDVCEIYSPQGNPMISPSCDIPLNVSIRVTKIKKIVKKIFSQYEEDTGFWKISFQRELSNAYIDNDLLYEVENFKIPINKKMVEQGEIFIYSNSKPRIYTNNPGLHINGNL